MQGPIDGSPVKESCTQLTAKVTLPVWLVGTKPHVLLFTGCTRRIRALLNASSAAIDGEIESPLSQQTDNFAFSLSGDVAVV